jgi:glycolate oxidase FAD binding subunit
MSTLERLATALEAVVGKPYVLTTPETTAAYAVDGVRPALVALPADATEIAEVLCLADAHQATVFPRGGGSHLGLGHTPTQVDLVLSVQRLQQQLAYEPGDMTTTVQAGMPLLQVQQALASGGQFLALDPPVTADTTVGGVVATNASGPRRLLYGTARDLLLGLSVVSIDGIQTKAGGRVVKNVTGYDLNKLYIGSLGTLAVIVELTFKVHPLPPGECTFGIGCAQATDLLPLLRLVTQLPLRLSSLEVLNATALNALRQHSSLAMPKTPYMLVVRLEGMPEVTASQQQRLSASLPQTDLTAPATVYTWSPAEQELLWQGMATFLRTAPGVLAKISVLMSDIPRLCQALPSGAQAESWPLLAHAGSGIVYINVPGGDHPEGNIPHLLAQLQALDASVASVNGHRVIERAPPAVKQQCQVWGLTGDAFRLMQALKASFDPHHRLNPGRFIGGL